MKTRIALALVSLLLASGCADPPPTALSEQTSSYVEYGAIVGRAVDDERVPLINATITLAERAEQTLTASDGSFAFPQVVAGAYTLVATHEFYNETTQSIQVGVDQEATVEFTLVKKPEFRPHNTTTPLVGRFECGAELPIITGPCWTLVEGTTCGPPVNTCVPDPVFAADYEFRFTVEPRWDTLIAELVWTAGANTMDGMRMYVENTNVSAQGMHGTAVSKVHGNTQPLTTRVDRGTPALGHEKYESGVPAFIPDDGGMQQIRVFPKGQAYQYTSQVCSESNGCFLGVGAALDVKFTVYLTVFYNGAAPVGFSAVPKP